METGLFFQYSAYTAAMVRKKFRRLNIRGSVFNLLNVASLRSSPIGTRLKSCILDWAARIWTRPSVRYTASPSCKAPRTNSNWQHCWLPSHPAELQSCESLLALYLWMLQSSRISKSLPWIQTGLVWSFGFCFWMFLGELLNLNLIWAHFHSCINWVYIYF